MSGSNIFPITDYKGHEIKEGMTICIIDREPFKQEGKYVDSWRKTMEYPVVVSELLEGLACEYMDFNMITYYFPLESIIRNKKETEIITIKGLSDERPE